MPSKIRYMKHSKKVYLTSTGALYTIQVPDDTISMAVYETSSEAKQSVDVGVFVPGQFRVNPYSHSSSSLTCKEDARIRTRHSIGPYYYEYIHTGPAALMLNMPAFNLTQTEFATDRNIALQKAYAKVGSSIFDGGTEFGELKETLQMLRSPLKGLRDFFLKDGRKNLKLLKEVMRRRKSPALILKPSGQTVAGTWLELRYGIRPFVKSIQDIAEAVNTKVDKLDATRIKTVRAKVQSNLNHSGNCSGGSTYTLWADGKYTGSSTGMSRGVVYFKQKQNLSSSRRWGLDLVNLPETAWQLTGLSFVWDWFFTIGPWISSFRFNPEFEILGATTSTRISTKASAYVVKVSGSEVGAIKMEENLGSPAVFESENYSRYVVSGRPTLPQFRGPAGLDLPRTVDGLALIAQHLLSNMR